MYSGRLHQTDKAADAFAKVLDALDDKSANRLSPSDQFRVLGDGPAMAYLNFGLVFLAAKRYELAVKALERGLVYDEDNSQISLVLAETLLKLNKGEQALSLVERHIQRQTPFVEAYELLAKVMKALKREKEITPRLEAAARRDSKNVPLQYILADRYRETGELDKAEALYKELLTSQPTPQTYRALAASLLKRKKAADLLKVISEAWTRPESQEAIKPQLQAAAADDAIAEAMLDAGLQQSRGQSTTLPKSAHEILSLIANNPGRDSHNKIRRLEKLLRAPATARGAEPQRSDLSARSPTPCAGWATMPRPRHRRAVDRQVSQRQVGRHPGLPRQPPPPRRPQRGGQGYPPRGHEARPRRRRGPAPARQRAQRDRPDRRRGPRSSARRPRKSRTTRSTN